MSEMIIVGLLGTVAAAPVLYLGGIAALLRADRKPNTKGLSVSGVN